MFLAGFVRCARVTGLLRLALGMSGACPDVGSSPSARYTTRELSSIRAKMRILLLTKSSTGTWTATDDKCTTTLTIAAKTKSTICTCQIRATNALRTRRIVRHGWSNSMPITSSTSRRPTTPSATCVLRQHDLIFLVKFDESLSGSYAHQLRMVAEGYRIQKGKIGYSWRTIADTLTVTHPRT